MNPATGQYSQTTIHTAACTIQRAVRYHQVCPQSVPAGNGAAVLTPCCTVAGPGLRPQGQAACMTLRRLVQAVQLQHKVLQSYKYSVCNCERAVASAQPCSHLPCAPLGSEDPNSLANQVNHALWQHTIALNSEQAKLQYLSMPLKHPLALAACGLFMLAENQAPREVWWQQAQVGSVWTVCAHHCVALILVEVTTCICGALQAMIAASLELDPSASFFSVAEDCFFKYAVAMNPRSARAWTNLALSQQCIRADYELVLLAYSGPLPACKPQRGVALHDPG